MNLFDIDSDSRDCFPMEYYADEGERPIPISLHAINRSLSSRMYELVNYYNLLLIKETDKAVLVKIKHSYKDDYVNEWYPKKLMSQVLIHNDEICFSIPYWFYLQKKYGD